jgi:hypothetical protein
MKVHLSVYRSIMDGYELLTDEWSGLEGEAWQTIVHKDEPKKSPKSHPKKTQT